MSSKQSFRSVCANPFRKEKHERGTDLRPLMEKQELAFPPLRKDIKIRGVCKKEYRNLDLQPSRVVKEPGVKVEEEM